LLTTHLKDNAAFSNSPRLHPCEDDHVPEHEGLCIAADGTSFGVAHFLGCA